MKEVSVSSISSNGNPPFEHWTIRFTVEKSGKQFVFFGVNHKDYLAFKARYYNPEAKGWSAYNYLKDRYDVEEVVEKTEEDEKKMSDAFDELRKKFK